MAAIAEHDDRAGRRRPRDRRAPPRAAHRAPPGSIIGCGRPRVNSSSPRSIITWLPWARRHGGRARHRHVRGDRKPRLPGTRAAPPRTASRRRTGRAPVVPRSGRSDGGSASAAGKVVRSQVGRRLERRGGARVRRQRQVARAEKADRERLVALRHAVEHQPRDRGSRRLRDQHDVLRRRIGIERVDRHQGGDGADLGLEVAPAGADRMADAAAGARDQARHFLDAGARGADDADVAARHHVGEGERRAGDDRGAAIRAHHHQAALARLALERHLVVDRHVVGENHHVEPERQALRASATAKCPGHRDQRQVGVGHLLHGGADRARACRTPPARPRRPADRSAASPPRAPPVRGRVVARPQRQDEIAGPGRLAFRPQNAGVAQDVLVGGRADEEPGFLDARQRRRPAGKSASARWSRDRSRGGPR